MQKHHSLRLKKNYYPHFVMGFLVFMGSLVVSGLVASVFAPVSESSAQTINVAFDNPGYYLSVTSADSIDLALSATLAGQVAVSDASTVTVKTNAPLGYKLYLSTEDDELRAADTDKTFKPVTTTALTLNTWGFSKTGTDNSWLAVPEVTSGNESSGYLLASKDGPSAADGDNTDIYYGINGSITMPAGNYSTTVTYTAIGDGIPEEHTMQEFTMAECVNMPVDQTFYLIDSRNNKIYSIVHARDDNCWMTQNLSIYNQQISSADSDLPSGTTITLPSSSTWRGNNYSAMLIHVTDGTGQYADKTGAYNGEVQYNWCAILGKSTCGEDTNVTVNQSICPKGWRLPVDGDTSTDKSWAKLMDIYNIQTGADLVNATSSQAAYSLGFHRYYGYWNHYYFSEHSQGKVGDFWSSTAYSNAANAYILLSDNTTINPHHKGDKGAGHNARCVLK